MLLFCYLIISNSQKNLVAKIVLIFFHFWERKKSYKSEVSVYIQLFRANAVHSYFGLGESTIQGCRQGRETSAPPVFDTSVNPISTGRVGGRLCPPQYYQPPTVFQMLWNLRHGIFYQDIQPNCHTWSLILIILK